MGLSGDKKNIFTTIGSFTSFNKNSVETDQGNTFSSVNNSDSPLPFMLDVLRVVSGVNGLRTLVGRLLGEISSNVNPKVNESVRNQVIQHNSDDNLPTNFDGGLGVVIPRKMIDLKNILKISPSSPSGLLIYGSNSDSYNHKLFDAINSEGTTITYNNLDIVYESSNDEFIFKKNVSSSVITINDFFDELIGNTNFVDKGIFTGQVMDGIFGGLSTSADKTYDELLNDLKLDKKLDNFLNGDGEFVLTESDVMELENKAKNLRDGVVKQDLGCGVVETSINFDDFNSTVNAINSTTNGDDISNIIDNSLDNTFNQNGDSDILNDNNDTIKDNYYGGIVGLINTTLTGLLILSPLNRTINMLSRKFSMDANETNVDDSLNESKAFIECISNDVSSEINKFLFDLIIMLIPPIVTPIIKKIIMEKLNAYINILKGLVTI